MDEPIAIIGVDARLPGDGDTAEKFYESLLAGRSARTEIPPERYNVDAFYHPHAERIGATRTREAHFLKGSISAFDAPFFSITPTEAHSMDPQQRGMLESVYKALENAGVPLTKVTGSQTGVYVGCFTYDYNDITVKDLDALSMYAATGTVASILSNRVSWFFDFRGPSMTIDTACSSSLVAAHEACMSLKLREINMAIVGGCNLILTPEMTLKLDAAGVLGPDGKSYSFDHRGNGYSRGEGFGVLVLKRMSDAIRDGDTIRAVIRNSSSNQDGRSPGITQPTKAGQAQLIRHVYSRAGLDPSLTRFFEAHGTGTKVGDPIEAGAISEVFTPHRTSEQPLYVGALKSNVGHLEGAAGVAAMIKGVFTLERGVIPGNIWFDKLNPNIDESWNLKFPTEPTVWPQAGLRRMSINSFGIGGSNAHVVMDDAYHFLQQYHLIGSHRTIIRPKKPVLDLPVVNGASHTTPNGVNGLSNGHTNGVTNGHTDGVTNGITNGLTNGTSNETSNGIASGTSNGVSNGLTNGVHHSSKNGEDTHSEEDGNARPRQLFVLSSYDQEGVKRVRDSYKGYIASRQRRHQEWPEEEKILKDLSYTLASKRTHHAWRSFSTAKSQDDLQNALENTSAPVRAKSDPRLAFVFTGQGAQWPKMGIELMAYPRFQQSLLAADMYLNSIGCSWSLTYELAKDGGASRIDNPEFCQPICTALQMALVDLLTSWNIHPCAITGHSSGEVAGAYAAGAISQEAAWKVSYYRGKFSAKLANVENAPKTGMAAVGLNVEETQAAIDRINQAGGEGTLEIACMNSWQSHTVSGDATKISSLVETLSSGKVFARKLNVEMAYHSQYMRAMATEYLEAMGTLEPGIDNTSSPQFFSSTYGAAVSKSKLQQAKYWVDNLVSPVRFCHSVTAMLTGEAAKSKVNGYSEEEIVAPKITDILEIGPHSALKGPLVNITKQCQGVSVDYHSVLTRKESGVLSAIETAGSLFCRGYDVKLSEVNEPTEGGGHRPQMLTDLPSYPFNHSKEYWLESRISKNFRTRPVPRHELLGAPVSDWNVDNAVWRNHIRLAENPWIESHKVSGDILYPAAGMLVMAIEASRQLADASKVLKGFRFKDVSFHSALTVPDDAQGVESHFHLRPYRETSIPTASKWHEFQLLTCEKSEWREHCYGHIQTEYETEYTPVDAGLEEQKLRERLAKVLINAETNCTTNVSSENVYRNFQESGLDFGPIFQTLSDVRSGPDFNLLAKVESPLQKIQALMPHGYVQPHMVHPATLDGILQAGIASITSNAKGTTDTRVPVRVEELWISAGPKVSHDSYLVSVLPKLLERNDVECSVTAFDSTTRQDLVYASGFLFKTIPRHSSQEAEGSVRKGAFNVDWKPDPTLLNEAQSSQVFALPMSPDIDPSDWMIDCETLCVLYIRRFIDSVSQDTREKMDWYHKKYVEWMEHVLQTTKLGKELVNIEQLEEKILARGVPEGKLIIAVGQALNDILGGPRDPLEVIFGNNLAENVYRNGLGSERCYLQLCNYIDALVHKNPTMQMLEIGAGTGGATRPVMETLSKHGRRYQHYTFTDISPSFFEQARENFSSELGNMSFKVLNVENDPLEQGFEAGTYDLIVAANVLHATKKIDVSLSNARKLLKPGGKLLLYEITNTSIILSSFCFGVLSGWWLSEDEDRRWGPLMPAETWRSHLIESGFTGLDGVFDDFPGSEYQVSSILVSGVAPTAESLDATGPVYILADDSSKLQKEVADGLSLSLTEHRACEVVSMESIPANINDAVCIVLAELEKSFLEDMTEVSFQALKQLAINCKNIIWITRGGVSTTAAPDMELSQGLARVARLEREDLKFVNLSFDQSANVDTITKKCTKTVLAGENKGENSVRIIDGIPHVPRLVKAEYLMKHVQAQTGSLEVVQQQFAEDPTRALALQIGNLGQLDTLRFEDDPQSSNPLCDDEVEFKPMACGINFRDLASALGKIEEPAFGLEAAGVVTRIGPNSNFAVGDRVFGISFAGVIKTFVRSSDGFLAKIPETMSWSEAAAIPIVYTTAYAVLFETGSIGKGDSILIHSAAGGFGQAAIQLAQHQGAEVFVTVGNDEKRTFLETTYGIPRDHIFSSRDLTFKAGIHRMTSGRGVDLVLNSLAGEALRATWDCVAPFGRFVELGVADINSNSRISMGNFVRNTRFEAFELAYRAVVDPVRTHAMFQRMVELVIYGSAAAGRKTPITTYPLSQMQDLFRQMQSGTHIGKLVLEPHDDDTVPVVLSQKPISQFNANASYVIAGGLGGLGRSVARWMASRGAKNLILLSRRGATHPSATEFIKELESTCDKVSAPACDVTDADTLKRVLDECLVEMPPVKGCIQGSMVLKDNRLEHMSVNEWNEAVRSKVNSSWNLHNVLGNNLDFMILLSSMIGVTGNPEQANYAAGGAFQDALARHLASQGLHAVCLDLPVVRGVGFVAEKPGLMEYMQSTGWAFMEENELHAVLDYHCRPSPGPLPIKQAQVVPRFWLPQETASEGFQLPAWKDEPIFNHLTQTEKSTEEEGATKKQVNHAALIAASSSIDEAEKTVLDALLLKISRVTSVEIETLDPAKPLHAYGVDSLVAVELRSWLSKELRAEVSVFDMTNKSSIHQLAKTITERSKLTPKFE